MFVATMLMAMVSGLLLPKGSDKVCAEGLVVNRQMPNVVAPGQTFDVFLTFTVPVTENSIGPIGVVDNAPMGWVTAVDPNWCTPVADDALVATYNQVNYIWFDVYDAGTQFTVKYKLNVPADVALGDYMFTGNVGYMIGVGDTIQVRINGQSQIQVNELPVVKTNDASNISTDEATLNGNVDSLGEYNTVNVCFEWGAASGSLDQVTSDISKSTTGDFNANLVNLNANTRYYFRTKLIVDDQTYYGDEKSFITSIVVSNGDGDNLPLITPTPMLTLTPTPTLTQIPSPYVVQFNIDGMITSTQITAEGVLQQTVSGTSAYGQISIIIPAGTTVLISDGTLPTSMSITSNPTPPVPPEDSNIIGMAYNFEPSGITFNPAITLVWSYDPETLPEGVDEANLKVAFYNTTTSSWEILSGDVDITNNKITVDVYHFTTFAVMALLPNNVNLPTPTPTSTQVSIYTPVPTLTPTPKPTLTPTSSPMTPTPSPTPIPEDESGNDGMPWWAWLLIILGSVMALGIIGFWLSSRHSMKSK